MAVADALMADRQDCSEAAASAKSTEDKEDDHDTIAELFLALSQPTGTALSRQSSNKAWTPALGE
jgi:hypothetical protein